MNTWQHISHHLGCSLSVLLTGGNDGSCSFGSWHLDRHIRRFFVELNAKHRPAGFVAMKAMKNPAMRNRVDVIDARKA